MTPNNSDVVWKVDYNSVGYMKSLGDILGSYQKKHICAIKREVISDQESEPYR